MPASWLLLLLCYLAAYVLLATAEVVAAASDEAAANPVGGKKSRVILTLGEGDIVDCIDGFFLLPLSDGLVSQYLRLFGEFERPLINLASHFIRLRGSDHLEILDIGSNVGVWTLPLAKLAGPHGRVHAFDAQLDMIKCLSGTLILNSIRNVFPVHAILTNVSGNTTLLTPLSTLRQNRGGLTVETLQESGTNGHPVEHVVLDDWFYKKLATNCPAFVKMDIEMHETLAILGGQRMLKECSGRTILFIEAICVYQFKTLFRLLDSLGYAVAWVTLPYEVKMENPAEDHVANSLNILAVPRADASLLDDFVAAGVLHRIDPFGYTTSGLYAIDDFKLVHYLRKADGMSSFEIKSDRGPSVGQIEDDRGTMHFFCSNHEVTDFVRNYWMRLDDQSIFDLMPPSDDQPENNLVLITLPGTSFWVSIAHHLRVLLYERQQIELFHTRLLAKRGMCTVVDVGMADGFYSQMAASYGCKVFSFEVQLGCIFFSNAAMQMNGFEDFITVTEAPVSNSSGTLLNIAFPEDSTCKEVFTFSGPVEARTQHTDSKTFLTVERSLSTIALGSFTPLADSDFIDLIKIDVAGHEMEVLQGAMQLLRKRLVRSVVIALGPPASYSDHDGLVDTFRRIASMGYSITTFNCNTRKTGLEVDIFTIANFAKFVQYTTSNRRCPDLLVERPYDKR